MAIRRTLAEFSDDIATADIADDSVTQAKIGADAVGTTELANDVAISTSGAITTTGAFTSVGIDDNADATAITIKSDETVGIRNTDPTPFNGVGIHIGDGSTSTASLALEDDEKQWDVYVNGGMVLRNTTASRSMLSLAEESGDVTVNTGDLIFETAGKGVVLGATTNVAANTLDDYEEGTFTATVATSGSLPTTWTQVSSPGYYTKIGNIVHVSLYVSISNSTRNGSGSLKIPLPITASNNTGGYQRAGSISDQQYLVWGAEHQLTPVALNNNAFCQLQEDLPHDAGVRTYLDINAPYTNWGSGQYCIFAIQITYQAA